MSVLTFTPIYQKRVWGGRNLETDFNRKLPSDDTPYGESWELTDRPNEQSIVNHGPHKGMSLNDLWTNNRDEIFGKSFQEKFAPESRFPLLVKILDAQDDLSIQVHPPQAMAEKLGGEAKTEMWFIAGKSPNAKLYVGLKSGVTQDDFHTAIDDGTVADVVHAFTPEIGESILLNSGRLHAIGSGFLIFEIQQNSDTTYRVFDWNRTGLDGKPRQLHVDESLECIDFSDIEPSMDPIDGNTIANCEFFKVDHFKLNTKASIGNPEPDKFSIINIVEGELLDIDGRVHVAGEALLMPKNCASLTVLKDASIMQTSIPD